MYISNGNLQTFKTFQLTNAFLKNKLESAYVICLINYTSFQARKHMIYIIKEFHLYSYKCISCE